MLLYLTDTVQFIDTEELYHTNMMQRRIDGLQKVLKRAKEHFEKVEKCNSVKLGKFLSAKKNKELLKDLEDDLSIWITQTYFVQLAENQERTAALEKKLEEIQNILNEFVKANLSNWDKFAEKQNIKTSSVVSAGGRACVDKTDFAVPPGVEHHNPTQTARTQPCIDVEYQLPAELRKSNSDFLIYHAYEDRDKARDIKERLLRKMPQLRLSKNGDIIVKVRIQILDEFRSSCVRQENLEHALKSCSVKLLLVTERFASLKGDGDHGLEIFKMLADSGPGEVFALRNDPDCKSYLKKLDFYVQALIQAGTYYDPNDDDFAGKMTDIFKRHVESRVYKDEEQKQKDQCALILKEAKDKVKKQKEERHMHTLKQRVGDIEEKIANAETEEEEDRLLEELGKLQL